MRRAIVIALLGVLVQGACNTGGGSQASDAGADAGVEADNGTVESGEWAQLLGIDAYAIEAGSVAEA